MEAVETIWCPRGAAIHTAPKADRSVLPAEGEAFMVCMTAAEKSSEMGRGRLNN